MSEYPNCLLLGILIPDDLPSKTYRAVCAEVGAVGDDPSTHIGEQLFHLKLMDGDYDEGMQVSAPSGSTVFVGMVTYGYGDTMTWEEFVALRDALYARLTDIAAKVQASVEIRISANHW